MGAVPRAFLRLAVVQLEAHIPLARDVHAPQVARPLAVLGVLACHEVHPVFVDDRRRQQLVARRGVHRTLEVRVELPDEPAGRRLVGVDPPVAQRRDDQRPPVDLRDRRACPLAVEDSPAGRVVGPHHFAGGLVEADDGRRIRRRQVPVCVVHAVAGDDVDQPPPGARVGPGHVVGEHAQPCDHVHGPQRGRLAAGAADVEAHHLAPAGGVPETARLEVSGAALPLEGPVVHPPGGQLRDEPLPQEGPGHLVEREQNAAVSDFPRVVLRLVVGADVDHAAGDDGRAVALRAQAGGPPDVAAGGHVPVGRCAPAGTGQVA